MCPETVTATGKTDGDFEDITLDWKGRSYTIPANDVMMAIAKIEDVITIAELDRFSQRGTAPVARLAQAFAAILRHAGARVNDDEVYASMFEGGATQARIMEATNTLLTLMLPPAALASSAGEQKKKECKARPVARRGSVQSGGRQLGHVASRVLAASPCRILVASSSQNPDTHVRLVDGRRGGRAL
nr:hypothetical protein [Alkalilimnicola ehrlichii]